VKIAAENTVTDQVVLSKDQYEKLLSENEYLKQQLKELKRMIFCSKSERFIPADESQLHLFDTPREETEDKQIEEITYKREKPNTEKQAAIRTKLPSHLPRIEEVLEPENIEEGSKKIGEEITQAGRQNCWNIIRQRYLFARS